MRRILPVTLAFMAPGILASAVAAQAAAAPQQTVEIKQWTVPWENTRPRDPFVAPDGKVWFVGQTGNYVANFDPATEEFKRFEITEGTNPHNVIVDEQGIVWFTGNANGRLGRLDPATGQVQEIMMPDPEAIRDPHTLFQVGDDFWFTAQGANKIGHMDRQTRELEILDVPTPGARPYGIWADASGTPWIVLFGTNKLATIDPETMALREIDLPREDARPRRMTITSDQSIWYVDYAMGMLGRYNQRSGEFREWDMPGGTESRPYATTVDEQDRIWFVETGIFPNRLVGFSPETQSFFSLTEIPGEGRNTVRHMVYDPRTKTIWFGTDQGMLGRATIN